MVRHYKKKTCRGEGSPTDILEAVRDVRLRGNSIRKASAEYAINYKTLQRYVKKIPDDEVLNAEITVPSCSVGYQSTRVIFSPDEEAEIENYVLQASSINFKLSSGDVRRRAYDVALSSGKDIPESWREHKKAGEVWFTYFMKRHPNLSVLTPQESIVAPSTCEVTIKMEPEDAESDGTYSEESPTDPLQLDVYDKPNSESPVEESAKRKKTSQEVEDESDHIGKLVAMQLRQLPLHVMLQANMGIQEILMRYRLKVQKSEEVPSSSDVTP